LNDLTKITYWTVFQFKMIFPYWIVGTIAGSFISVFLSPKIIALAGKQGTVRSGILAVIPAALLGSASPICMYGTVPLIASLGRKGVPQYLLVTFMISSILINPNLFIFSFALGAPIALARLASCLIAGIAAGILVRLLFGNRQVFNFDGFEEKKKKDNGQGAVKRLLSDMNRAILKTAPYFLVGILLAALYECYFSQDIIPNLFGNHKGTGVLIAASLGVPVYVCGGGTIPLLRAWLDAGMSPGSAIAFMLSGPATKITNLGAVKIILGLRNFLLYFAFNMIFAILAGFIVDVF
jgi:uncharacterized membrane protein YraQ (UPF0718 family)